MTGNGVVGGISSSASSSNVRTCNFPYCTVFGTLFFLNPHSSVCEWHVRSVQWIKLNLFIFLQWIHIVFTSLFSYSGISRILYHWKFDCMVESRHIFPSDGNFFYLFFHLLGFNEKGLIYVADKHTE